MLKKIEERDTVVCQRNSIILLQGIVKRLHSVLIEDLTTWYNEIFFFKLINIMFCMLNTVLCNFIFLKFQKVYFFIDFLFFK